MGTTGGVDSKEDSNSGESREEEFVIASGGSSKREDDNQMGSRREGASTPDSWVLSRIELASCTGTLTCDEGMLARTAGVHLPQSCQDFCLY